MPAPPPERAERAPPAYPGTGSVRAFERVLTPRLRRVAISPGPTEELSTLLAGRRALTGGGTGDAATSETAPGGIGPLPSRSGLDARRDHLSMGALGTLDDSHSDIRLLRP